MKQNVTVEIPVQVKAVLDALSRNGFRGYLVGGCLRDILLGVPPHDYDLTTNATPSQMSEAFVNFRVIRTGEKHGTLTVLSDGLPVEVTTHRVDGSYSDKRRPDCVSFTPSLEEDLKRRDFTVNAMAYSEETGLCDPCGGRADLSAGIIRAVGNPRTRFSEDALRILRCFRFSAQLDFRIESETARAAAECGELLASVSVERIFSEYSRTVTANAAARGLRALFLAGCAPAVFGTLSPDFARLSLLRALPPDAALRTALLISGASESECLAFASRLHTSTAFAKDLCRFVRAASEPLPDEPYPARRFVCRYYPVYENALLLSGLLHGVDPASSVALCRKVFRNRTAIELRRLAVNGAELQREAAVRPADTARVLLRLQDAVLRDPAKNKREILLSMARTDMKNTTHENEGCK